MSCSLPPRLLDTRVRDGGRRVKTESRLSGIQVTTKFEGPTLGSWNAAVINESIILKRRCHQWINKSINLTPSRCYLKKQRDGVSHVVWSGCRQSDWVYSTPGADCTPVGTRVEYTQVTSPQIDMTTEVLFSTRSWSYSSSLHDVLVVWLALYILRLI